MSISVSSILKQSMKFSFVGVLSKAISFPINVVIALVLVPRDYGIISLVGLWTMYFGLINPGFLSAATREIPHLLGRKNNTQAQKLQDVAFSVNLLWIFAGAIVFFAASFLQTETRIRIVLMLAACAFFLQSLQGCFSGFNNARHNFSQVATANLINVILTPALTISLIFFVNIYAIPWTSIISCLVVICYYYFIVGTKLHFVLDFKEIFRLIKIGIPLSLLNVAYWGYRLADKTMVASFLSLEQLGFYAYALGFSTSLYFVIADFTNILQPMLWKRIGEVKEHTHEIKELDSIAIYLSLGTALLINVLQLLFYCLTHFITVKFIPAIPLFYILAFNEYFLLIGTVPGIIMLSSRVNKQTINTIIWTIGLMINVIINYYMVRMGYGALGVALITVLIQACIALLLYLLMQNHFAPNIHQFFKLLRRVFLPVLVSGSVTALLLILNGMPTIEYLLCCTSAVFVVWVVTIMIFYKDYVSWNRISGFLAESVAYLLRSIRKMQWLARFKVAKNI